MRFSLTGDQVDAALLVQSIVHSVDHSLVAVHVRGNLETALQSKLPASAHRVLSPEEVFVASDIDTVIIAESCVEESMRLVRHASQADCHVVIIPPDAPSTAYSYEAHLLLDESSCGIVVLTGSWFLTDDMPTDSPMADCQLGLPGIADDSAHATTLMHAIDACSSLGFASSQVTVLGIDSNGAPSANRQVVLSGCVADGSVRPAVTFNCSRSAEQFHLCGQAGEHSVDRYIVIPGHVDSLPDDLAMLLCERVAQRLPNAVFCQASMEQFSRTLQVVGAVDRSIRRRRTIDVYIDELTERSVFKTQMTAIGCGVLTWLMLGMIGYLLVGQLLKPPTSVMLVLRALWIAPVLIYLATQFLLPFARGRQQPIPASSEKRTTEDDDSNTSTHSS
jgi:hypothetical protein